MGIHILSVNRKISVKALILYNQLPNSPIALDCAGASCPGGWDKGGGGKGIGEPITLTNTYMYRFGVFSPICSQCYFSGFFC